MKKWLLEATATIGWATVGVAVSTIVLLLVNTQGLVQDAQATHVPTKAYLQPGLNLTGVWCSNWSSYAPPVHPCWHPSSIGTAIDYNWGSNPNDDVGKGVALRYTYSGTSGFNHFKLKVLTYCKGVEARIYDRFVGNETYFRGQVRYIHINPTNTVDGAVPTLSFYYLGEIHGGPEIAGCGWTGPHLHQDANTASFTPFWTNWYGNHPNTHSHTICWGSPCP